MESSTTPGHVVDAYAPLSNTVWGGSRFVGVVQLRASGGRVWIRGRRVPLWWMAIYRFGWALVYVWGTIVSGGMALLDVFIDRAILERKRPKKQGGTASLFTAVSRTLSWRAADSRHVTRAVVRSSVNPVMDVGSPLYRETPVRKLGPVLTEYRDGESEVQAEVPLGLRGRPVHLCLEVANSQSERVVDILKGTSTESEL
jgi:hypothetical protein